jgi:hypothetical protein
MSFPRDPARQICGLFQIVRKSPRLMPAMVFTMYDVHRTKVPGGLRPAPSVSDLLFRSVRRRNLRTLPA